jgi:hypothetical protein
MSKPNYTEIFDAVQMDPEAKQVFLNMPREEQLLAILGMQAWTRSELVNVQRMVLDTRDDLASFKEESRRERAKREMRESRLTSGREVYDEQDDETSITQKVAKEIAKAMAQRFDVWIYFRDKILPPILIAVTFAILYQAFGGKVP